MFSLPFDSKITGYDSSGIPQYDRASGSAEFARLLAAFLPNGVFGSGMFCLLYTSRCVEETATC